MIVDHDHACSARSDRRCEDFSRMHQTCGQRSSPDLSSPHGTPSRIEHHYPKALAREEALLSPQVGEHSIGSFDRTAPRWRQHAPSEGEPRVEPSARSRIEIERLRTGLIQAERTSRRDQQRAEPAIERDAERTSENTSV